VASLTALVVFVVVLAKASSRVRLLLRDIRYRWVTRAVDRAMRSRNGKRPAA
jgi:hypothetical protein